MDPSIEQNLISRIPDMSKSKAEQECLQILHAIVSLNVVVPQKIRAVESQDFESAIGFRDSENRIMKLIPSTNTMQQLLLQAGIGHPKSDEDNTKVIRLRRDSHKQ